MRTYSHVILTLTAAERVEPRTSLPATLGAALPDLPVGAGAVWLWMRRGGFTRERLQKEACARRTFATPDAALHSLAAAAAALGLYKLTGSGNLERGRYLTAFLLGWTGHVVSDALTHGEDARPLLWPLSSRRFPSPISYWEKKRHGALFTTLEHAAVLIATILLLKNR